MALPIFQRTVTNDSGDVINGAEVTVVTEVTGLNAAIYSDREGVAPLTNPFFTGSDGLAQFYADQGEYRITVVGVSGTVTWRYVPLINDLDDASGALSAAISAQDAANSAAIAQAAANYKGAWLGKTGPGIIGESYSHNGFFWALNVDLPNLSVSEPTELNADWSITNGALRSDLVVQKLPGVFDESKMSALSIDGSSGVSLRHGGENLGVYTDFSFSVSGQALIPRDLSIDSFGFFWVLGQSAKAVFKYTQDGTYTGTSFDISNELSAATGIAIDANDNFWIVGTGVDTVFKYNPAGAYTGDSFSVSSESGQPQGVAIDPNGNFLVVDSTLAKVFKYDLNGNYTGKSSNVSELTTAQGIKTDAFGYFWVVGSSSDTAFKYNPAGAYTGDSFSVSSELSTPTGITIDSLGFIFVVGQSSDAVFKYTTSPLSTITGRIDDVDLGVIQIDGETNQAAMVKPLKGPSPVDENDYVNKNFSMGALRFDNYAKFSDRKPSGVDGGSSVSGEQTRDLNSTEFNNIEGVSLSTDQVTLPIGVYYFKASAPSFESDRHQLWVRNTGTSLLVKGLEGTSGFSSLTGGNTDSRSFISNYALFSELTIIDLRHYMTNAKASSGLGVNSSSGNEEIYTSLEIWKVG